MNESEIYRNGKAIAVIKHFGSNSVVGLMANHWQKCRKFSNTSQRILVTFPKELIIYANTIHVSENDLKNDIATAATMFKVEITVEDLSKKQESDETTGTNGLIFIQ